MEENKEVKKLSYEELENVAKDLYSKCSAMLVELQRMKEDNTFKRLDYLFKVVEYGSKFPKEFLSNALQEIQEIMTIPEEEVKTED